MPHCFNATIGHFIRLHEWTTKVKNINETSKRSHALSSCVRAVSTTTKTKNWKSQSHNQSISLEQRLPDGNMCLCSIIRHNSLRCETAGIRKLHAEHYLAEKPPLIPAVPTDSRKRMSTERVNHIGSVVRWLRVICVGVGAYSITVTGRICVAFFFVSHLLALSLPLLLLLLFSLLAAVNLIGKQIAFGYRGILLFSLSLLLSLNLSHSPPPLFSRSLVPCCFFAAIDWKSSLSHILPPKTIKALHPAEARKKRKTQKAHNGWTWNEKRKKTRNIL